MWEYKPLVNLINELINQTNGINFNLKIVIWGDNPMKKGDESDNFSSLWKITFENNKINFYVYKGCSVDASNNCDFNQKVNVSKIDKYRF